jgi:hypothetical protein
VDALVAQLRETITDLKRERDDWKEQAMRLALPAPRPEKPTTLAGRPWWKRLAG